VNKDEKVQKTAKKIFSAVPQSGTQGWKWSTKVRLNKGHDPSELGQLSSPVCITLAAEVE
jgi:hypothetical protein